MRLKTTHRVETQGAQKVVRVKVTNLTSQIAFFVQLALTQGRGGAETLPVLRDDNYFSLLPGESREVTARFAATHAGDATRALELGGWNIESDFHCDTLTVSPRDIKGGTPAPVTANISHTFLDGSRVLLRLDGGVFDAKRTWARNGDKQTLTFRVSFERPGRHTLEVGGRRLELNVQP